VLDRSGSKAGRGKLELAKQGVLRKAPPWSDDGAAPFA
jgi:hypothetical protein